MAETIIKTVLDVDKLFSEIEVNGENHVSERYEAPPATPVPTAGAVPPAQSQTPASTPAQNNPVQGSDVYAVELNDVLHNFVDRAVTEGLQTEVTARQQADSTLQGNINSESISRYNADQALEGEINSIEEKIPSQASAQNQLADKNFVNSSIATNTANFLGTYTSLADIEAIPNPTNNDYAFLETTDSAGNTLYDRYKYSAEGDEWLFEYELNNSGFTAEQWATINSGLTQQSVTNEIQQAISQAGGVDKITISSSQTVSCERDTRAIVTTSGVTITLPFGTSEVDSELTILALEDCTVTYYTDTNTSASQAMASGTKMSLLYHNGWIFSGVYGSVWN